jgi:ATP-dependent protease ClpP protease subunit
MMPAATDTFNEFISQKSGQPLEVIEKVTDRDTWFRGKEVVDFGLADSIIETA